jgi:hypothetical protein
MFIPGTGEGVDGAGLPFGSVANPRCRAPPDSGPISNAGAWQGSCFRYSLKLTRAEYGACMEPTAENYLRILDSYRDALREPAEPAGNRFELAFKQVIRLLARPSHFNDSLPAPFLDVAYRYGAGEPATLRHFGYDENRQFFLSDLHDYLALMESRARRAQDS